MAKSTKIKFKLVRLDVVEEKIDADFVVNTLKRKFPKETQGQIKVSNIIRPEAEEILITIQVYLEYQKTRYLDFTVENEYAVKDLPRHTTKLPDGGYDFKESGLLPYLISQSMSHTRAIQVIKFGSQIEEMDLVPFIKAKKLLKEGQLSDIKNSDPNKSTESAPQ